MGDELEFYGFPAANRLERRFAATGFIDEDSGMLAVDADGALVGKVDWHAVEYGPSAANRALRIGIALLPDARGKGYGTQAQDLLARYLFGITLVNRIEAGTDIANIAEQRSLEKAGFRRDGVMRQAQYGDGVWHDLAIYSKLRSEL
jgi:aminoglycoside 6'-N-acetyltransferase